MAFYFPQLDDAQSQGQHDESDGDPLGHLSQLGVQALGLVLGQEGVSAAGDSTGQASTLAGLQHNDSDQGQGQDHLEDSDSELHGKIVPFNAWHTQARYDVSLAPDQNHRKGYHILIQKSRTFVKKADMQGVVPDTEKDHNIRNLAPPLRGSWHLRSK